MAIRSTVIELGMYSYLLEDSQRGDKNWLPLNFARALLTVYPFPQVQEPTLPPPWVGVHEHYARAVLPADIPSFLQCNTARKYVLLASLQQVTKDETSSFRS